jgi:hypothetical protein
MSSKHCQNRAKSRRRAQVKRRAAEALPAPFQCEHSGFQTARALRDGSLVFLPQRSVYTGLQTAELRAKKYDVQAQYLRGDLARHTRDDDVVDQNAAYGESTTAPHFMSLLQRLVLVC